MIARPLRTVRIPWTLRDGWLDFWHALPAFRGRLAIARIVAQHVLTNRHNQVAWAALPNGFRMKIDLRWRGGYDVLYYFRTYEQGLASLIRRAVDVQGATFVDIGANIGAFCFLTADLLRRRGGKAFAIEPLPQNCAFLSETAAANGLDDVVQLCPVAIGDHCGALQLEEQNSGAISNARPMTWIEAEHEGELPGASPTTVPMTTLDRLAEEQAMRNVRFVKLDIEGAELFALKGAQTLLREQRPLVYAEFHRQYTAANGTTIDDVRSFASSIGFTVEFLSHGGQVTTAPPPLDSRFWDVILIPQGPSPHQRAALQRE